MAQTVLYVYEGCSTPGKMYYPKVINTYDTIEEAQAALLLIDLEDLNKHFSSMNKHPEKNKLGVVA